MLLSWAQAAEAGPAVAGGKGWNLGRMAQLGFPVPDGVVIPASCQELTPELREALRAWSDRDLAVRSSAALEDGDLASFAGIHESVLHVRGQEALEEAIQVCWRSLHSERARAYRQHYGLPEEAGGAVVLCRMLLSRTPPCKVPPPGGTRAAGVAFTVDPVEGRRDRMMVEVVPGLADVLVQGAVEPGRVVLQRGRLDYPILAKSGDVVLSDALWQRLARLLDRLHWALGDGQLPLDVEWVYAEERFWLVQARPVVRPARFTYAGLRGQPIVWSSANMSDSVPGVVSTLTWSLLQQSVEKVLYAGLRASGYPVPPGLEVVRRFSGRGYFDHSAVMWALYDGLGVAPAVVAEQIGGALPCIEVPPGSPMTWVRLRRALRMVSRIWEAVRHLPTRLAAHKAETQAQDAALGDPASRSRAELWQFLRQAAEHHLRVEPLAGLANTAAGFWYDMLLKSLPRDLVNRLLAGSGMVTSAEQGYRLYELSRLEGERFQQGLKGFLDDFGHRTVYEAEISNPRWVEDPTYLLEEVGRWRQAPDRDPRRHAQEMRRQAEVELRRRAGWRAPMLRWMLGQAQQAFALREQAKSEMVRGMLTLRRLLLDMAGRLGLRDRNLVFELAYPDLTAYLSGEWDGEGAEALGRRRAEQRRAWRAETPPEVILESDHVCHSPEPVSIGANDWQGQGVSSGLARGTARLLRTPEDSQRLAAGEVLVAPTTDPGWTPVFLRASAVVMETGGYLSHGAIVARELGLPAVVNLPGILERVRDGQRLEVDGTRGIVRVIPE